jgi:hypothetical protein
MTFLLNQLKQFDHSPDPLRLMTETLTTKSFLSEKMPISPIPTAALAPPAIKKTHRRTKSVSRGVVIVNASEPVPQKLLQKFDACVPVKGQ